MHEKCYNTPCLLNKNQMAILRDKMKTDVTSLSTLNTSPSYPGRVNFLLAFVILMDILFFSFEGEEILLLLLTLKEMKRLSSYRSEVWHVDR